MTEKAWILLIVMSPMILVSLAVVVGAWRGK